MRLKDVTEFCPAFAGAARNDAVAFVPMEALRYDSITQQEIPFEEARGKYTYFAEGDLLFAKVTPCFENGNIAVADNLKGGIGFGSSEIFVLRAKPGLNNRYLFYVVQASPFRDGGCATMCGVGGLKRMSPLFPRIFEWDVPSEEAQRQIADYLDEKTAAIDLRVTVLEQKLAAYKRLKASVINRAVTRGLDPKVKLKDSGVDWIGKIPAGWEIMRLKTVWSNAETGKRPTDDDEDVLSIGGEHIQDGTFCLDNPRYVSANTYRCSKGKISVGDLLIIKDGATIGKCMYVHNMPADKMLLNEHVYRLCVEKFYYYWLESSGAQYWFRSNNMTTAQESIPQNTLYALPTIIPPVNERKAIVAYLDEKTAAIDSRVSVLTREIELYKKLKRSLINEVVTGKRIVS